MKQLIGKINEFSWQEAVNGSDGQSSAPLFVCFWYGVALIFLTIIVGILLVVNAIHKIEVDFNTTYLFIGTQIGIVLTYLYGRKVSDNNVVKAEINKNTLNENG